jgi:penicillin-binding protein 1A
MTGAYTAFANKGMFNKPSYIRKITDKAGRILYQGIPERKQALSKNVAYTIMRMLKYNVKAAPGISKLKSDVGGKTGTTNDYCDGWFMGITPGIVVGTWVGGEDKWIRFLNIADGQGSAMARPFFAKFMSKLESANLVSYDSNARFPEPEANLGIVLDCSQYQETSPSGIPTDNVPTEFNPNRFQDEESSSKTPSAPQKTPNAATPSVQQPKKKPKAVDDGFGG